MKVEFLVITQNLNFTNMSHKNLLDCTKNNIYCSKLTFL